MRKPEHHLLVCASFKLNGEPKGACQRKGSVNLLQYLQNEILDRGIDVAVSSTGCLKLCEQGPLMVVYPEGQWYGQVDQEKIDAMLDAIEDGRALDLVQVG